MYSLMTKSEPTGGDSVGTIVGDAVICWVGVEVGDAVGDAVGG